ncbi:MAG: hypothetical protein U9N09_00515 [Euryarchaeota archaeon]|nr:hypothetical protein [Euryarchaeota archaeon]
MQEITITRFNEFNDRNMAEYDLIGTLLSITFAVIIGIITRLVIEGGGIWGVGCWVSQELIRDTSVHLLRHLKPGRSLNRESAFIYQHE